ncbi:hypothetical protein B4168_0319 [Anoxybacillus flavithermus]|nr:hypothetical protein B4168_0319 [Anoxybacillus flavithermus]OAO83730.1 hypothetical protein GT23_4040 [Parageobacillus thermoglucosidasius]
MLFRYLPMERTVQQYLHQLVPISIKYRYNESRMIFVGKSLLLF